MNMDRRFKFAWGEFVATRRISI